MAAVTINSADVSLDGIQFLEDVTITNQTAASTAVTKAVRVPRWATNALFFLNNDSQAGTTHTLDFTIGVPDWGSAAKLLAPTDDGDIASLGNAAWNGITAVTAVGAIVVVIEVGPEGTDDDTGSATASCWYGVKAVLPPWITYTYTTTDTADDADYAFRLAVQWKP